MFSVPSDVENISQNTDKQAFTLHAVREKDYFTKSMAPKTPREAKSMMMPASTTPSMT